MRIMIKGGVWKNSEDEILKAAVMKYGKNQWARISSLLVRKSAKQCKARWYEWLDPSIKKTEWTREEEEKLLHLAKIMPTQWRTIAPIVGRTAAQCLEHYEKLLDQAQKAEEDGQAGDAAAGELTGADDPRKLRPGEIDPQPESKPARPDPIDMDEDEKEMLSEARARLANTRGKKAKRKAREKQLEEAKRLAHLQKRRELLAAGIKVRTFRKSRKDMDYTREIPFEKRPAAGFFDTTEEDLRAQKERLNASQVGKLLEKYEGKRRDDQEALERKRDEKRRKIFEEKNLPQAIATQEKKNELPFLRSKLQLPAPQVSDAELEAVTKGGNASRVAAITASGGSSVTKGLVADYTPSVASRTPIARTDTATLSWEQVKNRELANLRAYHASSSALAGGQNTPVVESDFSGITPKRQVSSTPNPLVTKTPSTVAGASPSPSVGTSAMTPRSMSARDGFSINASAEMDAAEKAKFSLLKRDVLRGLDALPKPVNEYKVVVDEGTVAADEEEADADDAMVEDALDTEEKARRAAAEKVADLRERYLSTSAKKELPRPGKESVAGFLARTDARLANSSRPLQAQGLVENEVLSMLIRDDAVLTALEKGSSDSDRVQFAAGVLATGAEDDVNKINRAKKLVKKDLGDLVKTTNVDAAVVISELEKSTLVKLDSNKNAEAISKDQLEDFVEILSSRLQDTKSRVKRMDQHLDKREKKTETLYRGYVKRWEKLSGELSEAFDELGEVREKLHCFEKLRENEDKAAPQRLADAKALFAGESEREAELQARYKGLVDA
ncbi:hypothetical protein NDN08_008376 [Rhodosorus marinus]|uniref:Cell division cycle 5-like protein n=1 Tax=Rhodosorus marinus TaxID=101924 RepID=A0AAV8V0A0_9RHOD|nr:hypothetical protein NDN08_008376 [Rhodosorus marinus]